MKYIVKRSNRKTISLEVTKDLEVLIRAPRHMSESDIRGFAHKHRDWVGKQLERRKENFRPEPTAVEVQRLKTFSGTVIPERVAFYSRAMDLYPKGVKITSARTRFGSCSGSNSLCFSCFLMLYPPEAIDYVVVHELAHIRHKNHQKDFWTLVHSIMPDYKERRALLKRVPASYIPYGRAE